MKDTLAQVARFLDAGGVVQWADWQAMGVETQAAFVVVARRSRVEHAIRIGRATTGPNGVLEVMAELDDGDALEDALLRQAVTNAAG